MKWLFLTTSAAQQVCGSLPLIPATTTILDNVETFRSMKYRPEKPKLQRQTHVLLSFFSNSVHEQRKKNARQFWFQYRDLWKWKLLTYFRNWPAVDLTWLDFIYVNIFEICLTHQPNHQTKTKFFLSQVNHNFAQNRTNLIDLTKILINGSHSFSNHNWSFLEHGYGCAWHGYVSWWVW